MHLVAAWLVHLSTDREWEIFLLMPALTQWALVLPLAVIWWRGGRPRSSQGLLIAAGLIALGNFLCIASLPYTWALPDLVEGSLP